MKITLKNQSRRSGIALAAVAFVTFGAATALAAPPTGEPTFASADISIVTRDSHVQELVAGDLECSFRETGLGTFALVSYECSAAAAAVVEGCFFRNKFIVAAGTETSVGFDLTNSEPGHDPEVFLANNSGSVNGSVLTAFEVPHVGGGGGGHFCPEPFEQGVIAARWCGTSLTDTTNGLVGAAEPELFELFVRNANVDVPSCAEMLAP